MDMEQIEVTLADTSGQRQRPPLGLRPEASAIHGFRADRIREIIAAMTRYIEADTLVPIEWLRELERRLEEL
jgi:hypothetical protein